MAIVSPLISDHARIVGGGTHRSRRSIPATFAGGLEAPPWTAGIGRDLRHARALGSVVDDDVAKAAHLHPGSPVTLETRTGKRATYVVRGTYNGNNSPFTGFLVTPPGLRRDLDEPRSDQRARSDGLGHEPDRCRRERADDPREDLSDREIKTRDQFVGRSSTTEPDHRAALRTAGDQRDHLDLRHRQLARPVDLRAHARDRDAPRDRCEPPPDAADGALRERHHVGDRRDPRHDRRARSSAG